MKLFLAVFLFSASAFATLYGQDSRQLIRRSSNSLSPSRSVAIMIPNTDISDSSAGPHLKKMNTAPLSENQYLCPSERFSNLQSFYVSCTGFLIAPDLLVTAGHCAATFGEVRNETNSYCTDFSWYFDFEVDVFGNVNTNNIPAEKIYQCAEIIHAAHTSEPVSEKEIIFKDDFAIIKLKRAVLDRAPLKLTSSRPTPGSSISMIGHPLGGPKISVAGKVLSNEATYDRAAASGFDGNSGSPVFDSRGAVFGILVRGYPPSLIDNKNNDCLIVNRCSADGKVCTEADPNGQISGDHIMPLGSISKLKELGLIKER